MIIVIISDEDMLEYWPKLGQDNYKGLKHASDNTQ